ncbi:DUF4082 domain-containing protein [Rhizomonospora bruguierae]|uniref:DUF4082 domain-containing protein n=1 Tax=Rhizomonospora bruguierae TaxID=1581705 RepID=UPI001BCB2D25|nr:DUF4082 domain-containing protein [Micromonospora sp. NBRC 107566]
MNRVQAGRVSGGRRPRVGVGGLLLNRRATAAVALVAVALSGAVALPAARAAAADPCAAPVQVIACENTKAGTPESEWNITGSGDEDLQGFAAEMSVNVGETVHFKVTANASYKIEIYRLGYYNGAGARLITTVTPISPRPANSTSSCVTDPTTEIFDCGGWAVSAQWAVPSTSVSGVYIARLKRDTGDGDSHIPFVVRNDASHSDLIYQTSDTTWQAYNTFGGSSFYTGAANGRAYKLSYNRPFATRDVGNGRDFLFSNEYPMIRFLERNGYDVSYLSGIDTDRRGGLLTNHKVFLSVGHDEYWSGQQRANVEAARDAGVSLAFFSGNEVYWRTRWENSQDGTGTPYRTLVCYKETWADDHIDPTGEWTGTFRDPRFTPPATGGGAPENALTGTIYMANHDDLPIQVPAEQGKLRIWRNTTVANQSAGQTMTLAQHTVGYESDEDIDNGFRPAGLIRLSTTTGSTPEYLRDFGNTVSPGTTTHHMTLYRAASGALVFSAGTIQFAWSLDANHDGLTDPADSRLQQMTVNLFADMGAQPATRMSTLVAATPSTDSTAPTVTITAPANGAGVVNGGQVTVQGTATDTGGRVAAVEVSTDGGATWHPANGTSTWSYSFYTNGLGSQTVLARAVDDSANIGPASAPRTLTLTGPSTMFGARVPQVPAINDDQPVELGVAFVPQVDGLITGVRFYKGPGNTGTHTGSVWSPGGTRLKTGTFANETASGWQTLTFSSPLAVGAGTTYIASYYAPRGGYAGDPLQFSYGDLDVNPLTVKRSTAASGNGLYRYGSGLPDQWYRDTNYYVDVTFQASANTPPSVISVSPLDEANGVSAAVRPQAAFSKALNTESIEFTLTDGTDATVAGSVGYDGATRTVTFTPAEPLAAAQTYTATVQARDTDGHSLDAPYTWTFTTDVDATLTKLFATDAVPGNATSDDPQSAELGVKFTPVVDGYVVGVRFYQGPGNTGTHTGSLWRPDGTRLAQATFPASSGGGWQVAAFTPPVQVTAGTTYVASYFAPNGNYSYDTDFFDATWTNGPLSAPSGANGVYGYAAQSTFPTQSFQSSNYWVDPLFYSGAGTPPLPTPSTSPSPTVSPTPSPTETESPSPTPTPTVTFPPVVSIFDDSAAPATASWDDTSPVEVGVRFHAEVAGKVTGIRFYKGGANTGTHVGSLWTAGGQLLASGTFEGETATGWQTLTFTAPIDLLANTEYVASYRAPNGGYAVTANTFAAGALHNPPLHVPPTGAMYTYEAPGTFPSNTSNHNYWVDVVFEPNS